MIHKHLFSAISGTHLVFLGSLFMLQLPLFNMSHAELFKAEYNVELSILLIILVLVEPFLLYAKLKRLRSRKIVKNPNLEATLGLGHMLVSVFVFMMILDGFVPKVTDLADSTAWLLIVVVIKELGVMGILMATEGASKPIPYDWKEGICDLVLVMYASLAYSIFWLSMDSLEKEPLALDSVETYILILAGFLLFSIFYYPLRATTLLEELDDIKYGRVRALSSYLLHGIVIVSGLSIIFF